MLSEKAAIKRNWPRFARCLQTLIQDVEAVVIGVGWLSLVSFLSYGGCLLSQTISPAPVNVDQPLPDPAYDQVMTTDSLIALGCSAALVALLEVLRRHRGIH